MKWLLNIIKHNQTLIVAIVVCGVILWLGLSCQPTVKNPFDVVQQVTRAELDNEVENYVNKVTLAYADLQRQEQIRATLINAGLAYTKGEGISIFGLISTLSGIIGVGAVVDNRRKDAVIKSKSNALLALTTKSNGV